MSIGWTEWPYLKQNLSLFNLKVLMAFLRWQVLSAKKMKIAGNENYCIKNACETSLAKY